MCGLRHSRYVLDPHCDGAGARTTSDQCSGGSPRLCGTDQGIVGLDFDAELADQIVGQLSIGPISAGWHESVVTSAAEGEVDERDRGLSARHDEACVGAFQISDAQSEARAVGLPLRP